MMRSSGNAHRYHPSESWDPCLQHAMRVRADTPLVIARRLRSNRRSNPAPRVIEKNVPWRLRRLAMTYTGRHMILFDVLLYIENI